MKTKTRTKTVERGMLTGTGETTTEAKENLSKQIDSALTGRYEPFVVSYGIYSAIVYRAPDGWKYRMLNDASKPGIHDVGFGMHEGDRDTVIQHAASHVIDVGSNDDEFHKDEDIPSWLTDKHARSTILGNARFRRAYRYNKETYPGGCDSYWHRWACENANDPRFA